MQGAAARCAGGTELCNESHAEAAGRGDPGGRAASHSARVTHPSDGSMRARAHSPALKPQLGSSTCPCVRVTPETSVNE